MMDTDLKLCQMKKIRGEKNVLGMNSSQTHNARLLVTLSRCCQQPCAVILCGRGAGKQHMLCWHRSLVSDLWVMVFPKRSTIRGVTLDKDTWQSKDGKTEGVTWEDKPSASQQRGNVASVLQQHQQDDQFCKDLCGWHHTHRQTQLDGCRWVQGWQQRTGEGGWSIEEWVTSCQCSL